MRKLKIYEFKPLFTVFFFRFHTYYVIFSEILTHFLAQNFKTQILTAQKNQLLEGLVLTPP